MDVFQRSLQIFEALQSRYPDNRDYLFERSQALFYVGYIHYDRGEFPQALDYFTRYHDDSQRLYELDPANTGYVMEMAYSHVNLFNVYEQMIGSDPHQLVDHASEGVHYNELALELEPGNEFYLRMLSETTADLADALMGVCDLGVAYQARLKSLTISRELLERNTRNAALSQRVANALSGLGHIEASVGNSDQALSHYLESRQIFEDLLAQEPTNTDYQWYHLWKWSYSAKLLSDLDRQEEAWEQFAKIRRTADRLMKDVVEVGIEDRITYGRFLTDYAEVAYRRGEAGMAELLIGEGLDLLAGVVDDNPDSYAARRELTRALIRARIVGFEPERSEVSLPALDLADRRPEAMSCDEVSLAMQDAVIAGKRKQAGVFAGYLRKKGYWHPGLIRFCQAHEDCGDYALGLL
jgi:tetratricopeptide (TPR) repeat protein